MQKQYYPKIQNWNTTRSLKTRLDIEAMERDGNKCVKCNKLTGLEVHHFIRRIEKIDNLITLCHSCHKKEHGMAGCFKKGFDSKRNSKPTPTSWQNGHIPWNKGKKRLVERKCIAVSCGKRHYAKDLCHFHYFRQYFSKIPTAATF